MSEKHENHVSDPLLNCASPISNPGLICKCKCFSPCLNSLIMNLMINSPYNIHTVGWSRNPLSSRTEKLMAGGRSDSTVIQRRQQQLGRMADFLPSVTFSVFDL